MNYTVNIETTQDPEVPEEFVRIAAVVIKGGAEIYRHTAAIPKSEYSKEFEQSVADAALNKVLHNESLKELETPDDPEEKESDGN